MNYKIITTDNFNREVKILVKKYHSFIEDLKIFNEKLLKNPEIGDKLGGNVRKVRMAITDKNKGKRGGARVITCSVLIDVENTKIYLLAIYDKNEQDSISAKKIEILKKQNGI